MDPLTRLVTALAAGAAAALQSTVEQSIKDGSATLKGLIQRKYAQVNVERLEAQTSWKNRRGVVEEDLKAVGATRMPRWCRKPKNSLRSSSAGRQRRRPLSVWTSKTSRGPRSRSGE
jgi:hypothetical protein